MGNRAFLVNTAAVKADCGAVLVAQGKNHAAIKKLMAFWVQDADLFEALNRFLVIGQDIQKRAIHKPDAEVFERLIVAYSSLDFQVI